MSNFVNRVFKTLSIVALLLVSTSVSAQQLILVTWDQTSGLWSNDGHWMPVERVNNGGGKEFIATIPGGTVILDQHININGLRLAGGVINGVNTLTLTNDTFLWSSGHLEGIGLQSFGGIAIFGGNHTLGSAGVIRNWGTANWSSGDIFLRLASVFENEVSGVFRVTGDNRMVESGGGLSEFNNLGTFIKSDGLGTTWFNGLAFNNTGFVIGQSGIIQVGTGTSSGRWDADGGTIRFGFGTHELNSGTNVIGNGTIEFFFGTTNLNSGTYDVSGATRFSGGDANFSVPVTTGELELLNGNSEITGGETITVTGLTTWEAGEVDDFTIRAEGGMALSMGSHDIVNAGTIVNTAVATWSGGDIRTGAEATINNIGDFQMTGNDSMNHDFGGAEATFNNLGTMTKSIGLGSTKFNGVVVNNPGLIKVNSGTIEFDEYNQSNGDLLLNSGAVQFRLGTREFNSGNVSGNGTVEYFGGITNVNNSVVYDVDGTSLFTGGDAKFFVDATTRQLELSSAQSRLNGPATLTATGQMTWSAGQIDGGMIQADGNIDILEGSHVMLNGGVLNNSGVATWILGDIRTGGDSTINNESTGEFLATGNDSMRQDFGGVTSTFNNAGIFKKASNGVSSFVAVRFNNSGTVKVTDGVLEFSDFVQTAGTLSLDGGDVATVSANDVLEFQGGDIVGTGTLAGNVNSLGGAFFPGFSAGQITVDGDLALGDLGKVFMEIGGHAAGTEFDYMDITGDLTLDGDLNIELINGFENSIQVGDKFTMLSSSSLSGSFDNVINGGILSTGGVDFEVYYGTASSLAINDVVVRVASIGGVVQTTANSFLVTRGDYVSGGLTELAVSDNGDLVASRSAADVQSRVFVEVESTSPVATPVQFGFKLESAVFARLTVIQSIDFFNYVDNGWEEMDMRNASRFSDAVVDISPGGDLSRFVESGARSIKARIRFESASTRQRFSAFIDQAVWTIQ